MTGTLWRRWSRGPRPPAAADRAGTAAPLTFGVVCIGRVGSEHHVADRPLDELTRHNPVLRLEYTELADAAALAALQRFLGVEPTTLRSPHRKIVRTPLEETIVNFDEVRTLLTGTPWEPFLPGEG